jgi:hypothetical protein
MATDIEAPGSEGTELTAALAELLGWKNVKGYGATGDGTTDDTAAIQAAIDDATGLYSSNGRGTIYFPPTASFYKTTAPLTYHISDSIRAIKFVGSGAGSIGGQFDGFVFARSPESPGVSSQRCIIEFHNIEISNNHATGSGIDFNMVLGGKVVNCRIATSLYGVRCWDATSMTIDTCNFACHDALPSSSIAIMGSNGLTVLNCDVVGWNEGVRHHNLGLNVIGGRWEENGYGIVMGLDQDGGSYQTAGALISGISMESNKEAAIYVASGQAISIVGCAITANTTGDCDYGVRINSGNNIGIRDTVIGGAQPYVVNGFSVNSCTDLTLDNVLCTNYDFGTMSGGLRLSGVNRELTVAEVNAISSPDVGDILPVSNASHETVGTDLGASTGANHVAVVYSGGAWRVI